MRLVRRRHSGAAATALALGLAGCSVAPPPAPEPVTEIPASWSAERAPGEGSTGGAWWTAFGDRELDGWIERALAANRDLRAAAARVEEALALARIAGAGLKPQAGIALDGARQRRNFIGFPIPGGGDGVLSTTTTTFGSSLNISWEADLWGRLRAQRAAARVSVEAYEADLAGARLSLAGQTAKAWFALIEARRQVELAEQTLGTRSRTLAQIRRRFQSGLRTGLDLRLAIANEAAALSTLAGRRRRLDGARRQLELLVSSYPAGAVHPEAEEQTLPAPPTPPPAGLPSDLVARRPDLAAAERRLTAAGLGVAQARASLYPRFALTGSAGRLSEEVEDLLDDDFSIWALAANLLQPLYQGGRLKAGVELSEARYRQLAEGYAQAVLRALAEVELALTAEGFLVAQEDALREAATQSLAAQRLALDRYNSGLGPYLAVLEAQREAFLARSRLLEVQRQRLDARVDLHLALGGGWEKQGTAHGGATVP